MTTFSPDKHYWGRPCKRGHEGLRFKSTNGCVDCHREHTRGWRKKNPERTRKIAKASQKRNRATKKQATPLWYEENACYTVYKKASRLGGSVDHIVPLKSDIVCGLHCHANLQILPPEMNISKGNKHWPDMPEETI